MSVASAAHDREFGVESLTIIGATRIVFAI